MSRTILLDSIKNKIKTSKTESVFVAADFADISDRAKIGVCLNRLEEEGIIKRILRGVYYKPEFNSFLGEYVAPNPDTVANALARNYGWTIVPCGDTALNLLGLSEQVPAQWVYVSDGAYREYSYGNATLYFKRTAKKELSNMSPKSALIVQALKTCGKDGVTPKMIERLRSVTTDEERKALLSETQYATSWIYETIKEICQ